MADARSSSVCSRRASRNRKTADRPRALYQSRRAIATNGHRGSAGDNIAAQQLQSLATQCGADRPQTADAVCSGWTGPAPALRRAINAIDWPVSPFVDALAISTRLDNMMRGVDAFPPAMEMRHSPTGSAGPRRRRGRASGAKPVRSGPAGACSRWTSPRCRSSRRRRFCARTSLRPAPGCRPGATRRATRRICGPRLAEPLRHARNTNVARRRRVLRNLHEAGSEH